MALLLRAVNSISHIHMQRVISTLWFYSMGMSCYALTLVCDLTILHMCVCVCVCVCVCACACVCVCACACVCVCMCAQVKIFTSIILHINAV